MRTVEESISDSTQLKFRPIRFGWRRDSWRVKLGCKGPRRLERQPPRKAARATACYRQALRILFDLQP